MGSLDVGSLKKTGMTLRGGGDRRRLSEGDKMKGKGLEGEVIGEEFCTPSGRLGCIFGGKGNGSTRDVYDLNHA